MVVNPHSKQGGRHNEQITMRQSIEYLLLIHIKSVVQLATLRSTMWEILAGKLARSQHAIRGPSRLRANPTARTWHGLMLNALFCSFSIAFVTPYWKTFTTIVEKSITSPSFVSKTSLKTSPGSLPPFLVDSLAGKPRESSADPTSYVTPLLRAWQMLGDL